MTGDQPSYLQPSAVIGGGTGAVKFSATQTSGSGATADEPAPTTHGQADPSSGGLRSDDDLSSVGHVSPGEAGSAPTGHVGRGEAVLTWAVRGPQCEAVLTWSDTEPDDDASVGPLADAVAGELIRLRSELESNSPPIQVLLVADHRGASVHPLPETAANAAGLTEVRDLFELRRPLPVERDHPARDMAPPLAPRAFRPGYDDDAWLRINNRAFATHPDQGRETPSTLESRMAEPWFDAADFLVLDDLDRPDELSGFCWTKVEIDDTANPGPGSGEIYVIAVDPAHHGEGLGAALVLAGLDHMTERGVTTATLYVDETNTAARSLYNRLGFVVHHRRRVRTTPMEPVTQ